MKNMIKKIIKIILIILKYLFLSFLLFIFIISQNILYKLLIIFFVIYLGIISLILFDKENKNIYKIASSILILLFEFYSIIIMTNILYETKECDGLEAIAFIYTLFGFIILATILIFDIITRNPLDISDNLIFPVGLGVSYVLIRYFFQVELDSMILNFLSNFPI